MRSSGPIDSGRSGTGVFLAVSLVVIAVLVAVFVAPWSDDEPDDRASDSAGAAQAFIAAPWTLQDGGSTPEGRHYALTHWYADPDDRSRSRQDEVGYTMYCSSVTPDVVRQWMRDYPLENSPEGHPVNM